MSIRYFTCNCHTNPDIVCPHDNDPFNQRRMRTDWTVADFDGLSCEQVEKINESNQRYNDLVEGIEDLNIAIAMRQIDEEDKAPRKTRKARKRRRTYIGADVMDELYETFESCPADIKGDLEEFGFDFDR